MKFIVDCQNQSSIKLDAYRDRPHRSAFIERAVLPNFTRAPNTPPLIVYLYATCPARHLFQRLLRCRIIRDTFLHKAALHSATVRCIWCCVAHLNYEKGYLDINKRSHVIRICSTTVFPVQGQVSAEWRWDSP